MKRGLAVDRWPLAEGGSATSANGQQPTANQHNWRALYTLVIAELAITILIFYAFTKLFE